MKLHLDVDSYKGVDGSSLSEPRCEQIVLVYEMLEKLGNTVITYRFVQEEAQRQKLFGATRAKSAIRTFFPLLKKLDFVEYEGEFNANHCFTELGKTFALACRALYNVTDDTPHRDEVIARLENIKRNAQKMGLINMYHDPEWREHNMWVALKLFKELRQINWNEYLYTLYCIQTDRTIADAIEDIKRDKRKIDSIVFVNESGGTLPTTCYTYIRSFLEEAGLIFKFSRTESKLTSEADLFYSQISI